MLQTIDRWRVVVTLSNGTDMTFWVNENYLSNVLRKIADMQFTETGLDQPRMIVVSGPIPIGGSQQNSK